MFYLGISKTDEEMNRLRSIRNGGRDLCRCSAKAKAQAIQCGEIEQRPYMDKVHLGEPQGGRGWKLVLWCNSRQDADLQADL